MSKTVAAGHQIGLKGKHKYNMNTTVVTLAKHFVVE